jgi:hypothetical protein
MVAVPGDEEKITMPSEEQTDSTPESRTDPIELPPGWVRIVIVMLLAITLLLAPLLIVIMMYFSGDLLLIAKSHAPAVIGVPWAGGAAFIVVLVLRTSFGAIDFTVLGVNFKGASGPIVMWVFCFLVEVAAIKILW